MSQNIPLTVAQTAALLGYQGRGTHTSPSYLTVLKACQTGELRAYQRTGRKGTWLIDPDDAIAWRSGRPPVPSRRKTTTNLTKAAS